jgi:hypothetical protein
MSTLTIETSPSSKRVGTKLRPGAAQARSPRKAKTAPAVAEPLKPAEAQREGRVTKQERVLTLLSRSVGASIEEMMQARTGSSTACAGSWPGPSRRSLASR